MNGKKIDSVEKDKKLSYGFLWRKSTQFLERRNLKTCKTLEDSSKKCWRVSCRLINGTFLENVMYFIRFYNRHKVSKSAYVICLCINCSETYALLLKSALSSSYPRMIESIDRTLQPFYKTHIVIAEMVKGMTWQRQLWTDMHTNLTMCLCEYLTKYNVLWSSMN